MDFVIKAPTHAHAPHIAKIWSDGWHDAHDAIVPDALRKLRTDASFMKRTEDHLSDFRIAAMDDDVLGFHMTRADELYQMYVSAKARGTGVARALIADAEARILASGHGVAWLACAVGNARAMRFYEKSGWVNQGRRSVELDTPEVPFTLDVWRYEKAVNADSHR